MAIPLVDSNVKPTQSIPEREKYSATSAKNAANIQILESAKNHISAKDDPLQLVYRAAITKLNEELEEEFGPNAIQESTSSGIDVSPEATANRIVSLATSFYGAYKTQHTGADEQQTLDDFMSTIRSGIDKGFAEATDILRGLSILEGDIATDIDKTYDLVQDGLDKFYQQLHSEDTVEPATETHEE